MNVMKKKLVIGFFAAVAMMMVACGGGSDSDSDSDEFDAPNDLYGTVWKCYSEDISIMSEAERREYENRDGNDGNELRFVGNRIVKYIEGDYRGGKLDGGVDTYEYSYKKPNGSIGQTNQGGNIKFVVDGKIMIVYWGRGFTKTFLRVK